jgi:hypothetical protein
LGSGPSFGEIELEPVRTNVHLIARTQDPGALDPLAADERTVGGLEVDEGELAIHIEDAGVVARYARLDDDDVVAGRPSDRDLALVEGARSRWLAGFRQRDA